MHAALKLLIVASIAGAAAACHKNQTQAQDQNMSLDQPLTNETMANADIEMLPPDESSVTPSNELASGSDNPDVNDLNASGNSD